MGMNEGNGSDVSFLVEWSQAKSGEGARSKWVEMLNLCISMDWRQETMP